MNRLIGIVAGAVLVGGIAGAGIAGAVTGNDDSTSPSSAAAEAAEPAPTHSRLTPEAIYERAAPGVVVISATQTENVPATAFTPTTTQKVEIGGSGFVIDRRGDIVTNDHVVEDATNVRVGFSGGATYPAEIVGADPSTDLAVIRVDAPASALRPLSLADSGAAGDDGTSA
jgi:S1-C subfamily serine protease